MTAAANLIPIKLLIIFVFALATLVSAAGVQRARRMAERDTRVGLTALLAFSAAWAGTQSLRLIIPGVHLKTLLYIVGLVVGFATILSWLYFASAYSGRDFHQRTTLRRAVLGLYLIVVTIKITNPLHQLYFTSAISSEPFTRIVITQQPLYWFVAGIAYALTGIGIYLLYDLSKEYDQETHVLGVLVGVTIAPSILTALGYQYQSLLFELAYEPLGVAAFAIGALFLFEERFLAVGRLGKREFVRETRQPALVIDQSNIVSWANDAAAHLFLDDDPVGMRLSEALPPVWEALSQEDEEVIQLAVDGETRQYILSETELATNETPVGQLLLFTDVTTIERQRKELERQVDVFQKAQDIADVGGWEYDVQGNDHWASEKSEQLLGVTTGEGLSLEQTLEHIHPDDRETVRAAFEQSLESGDPYDLTARLIKADGTQKWVRARGEGQFVDGELRRLRGTLQDVTDRVERTQELERQVDLFNKAQDIADVGAWEYDTGANELYWTQKVYEIHQMSPDTALNVETALGAYRQADRKRVQAAFTEAVENGESYELEAQIQPTDGELRWVQTMGEPQMTDDGDVVRIRGTIQDITERKKRIQQLQEMTDAVDTSPIGVVIGDSSQPGSPFSYVNDGFEEQTGYAAETALGNSFRLLAGEQTDESQMLALENAITNGKQATVTMKCARPNGGAYWTRVDVGPVTDDDNNVVRYVGFLQDVTELKQRERQLGMLDRYLRHNVRNKMNLIRGQAELIESEASPPVSEYAQPIFRASDMLIDNMERQRSITQMLQCQETPTQLELMELLQSAIGGITREHPNANVSLSGPDSLPIRGISTLSEAFAELARNGIIHASEAPISVDITVKRDGDMASVAVGDSASGIPESEFEVLQNAGSESPIKHGQGLGLWLVFAAVERSGGSIELTETTDEGSIVTVHLPLSESE